jgi:hypothetical protein
MLPLPTHQQARGRAECRLYQPDLDAPNRQQALQCFVNQVWLRQEAVRTHIVQVDAAEVSQPVQVPEQPLQLWKELERERVGKDDAGAEVTAV